MGCFFSSQCLCTTKRLGVNCEPGGGGGRKAPKAPPPSTPRRAPFMTKGLDVKELRAGGWRGPESAEGAGPRSPPASAVHGETEISGFVLLQKRVTSPSPWPILVEAQNPTSTKIANFVVAPQNHDGLLGGSHGECACPCVDDARRSALNSPTGESPRAARPRKP